jgi:hypothetical protein
MKNIIAIPTKKVKALANEYFKDPNCWPSLWISTEDINIEDKMSFISLVISMKRENKKMIAV